MTSAMVHLNASPYRFKWPIMKLSIRSYRRTFLCSIVPIVCLLVITISSQARFNNFLPTCLPKKKIAFLKTHKCASSTVQNIVFRYGEKHDLKFVFPMHGNYLGRSQHFNSRMVQNTPWHRMGYDIFTLHTVWNFAEIRTILGNPSDLVSFSIIRDPVNLFESLYSFAQWDKLFRMDITKFANVINYNTNRSTDYLTVGGYTGHNQMLHDFGLPDVNTSDIEMVKSKILAIENDFDLIMVAEYMEESLVLLKHLLCWDLRDVTSLPLNERHDEYRHQLNAETRSLLRQWLWADQMLYDHFLNIFNMKKLQFGEKRLHEETNQLRALNKQIKKKCNIYEGNPKSLKAEFRPPSTRVKGFTVSSTMQECKQLARSELVYIDVLRERQFRIAYMNSSVQSSGARGNFSDFYAHLYKSHVSTTINKV